MNILLVSPKPPPSGGIATWTEQYLAGSVARDNEIELLNVSITGNRANNFAKKSIYEEMKRTINILQNLKTILKKKKYSVAHLNTSCSKLGIMRDMICALKIKKTGCPIIVQCHCSLLNSPRNGMFEFCFKRLCKTADKILVLDTKSKEWLLKKYQTDSIIIPNFISLSGQEFHKQISEKLHKAVFVGHVLRSKGCMEVLELAEARADIEFRLVGNISDEFKNIKLPHNVTLVGEVAKDAAIEEMRQADILLLPSYSEGFPLVILEAMMTGTPVIASDVGAISDMLGEGGGIVIPPRDTEALIKAVETIEPYELRCKMSEFNFQKVMECYETENVLQSLTEIYREVAR